MCVCGRNDEKDEKIAQENGKCKHEAEKRKKNCVWWKVRGGEVPSQIIISMQFMLSHSHRLLFQLSTASLFRTQSLTSSSFCPRNVIFMRIWWLYCIWTFNSAEFALRVLSLTLNPHLRIANLSLSCFSSSLSAVWFDSASFTLPGFLQTLQWRDIEKSRAANNW